MGILERFAEREGTAENFLTLKKRLPPLNSSYERLQGKYWLAAEAVIATRAIPALVMRKGGNWVEPRVIKLVPVSGTGFFIFCANMRHISKGGKANGRHVENIVSRRSSEGVSCRHNN
jgi:hypothetical protein